MSAERTFDLVAGQIAAVGRRFYGRGWVLGTSGNFSAVLSRVPLRLVITPSMAHKGHLAPEQILEIDEAGRVLDGRGGRPSAETLLHLEIVKTRGAGAVLHTHSVWSTMLSGIHEARRGFTISGYEMLKGLSGVTTHLHHERVPVVANDQNMERLGRQVHGLLEEYPESHAFVIARHGLYTWGETLADAERHVEILEFLFEVIGRSHYGADTHSG
jgi:methylthioribulose-1-phosphate dehydratase